jgi:hypothetical protein
VNRQGGEGHSPGAVKGGFVAISPLWSPGTENSLC